jgi:hypothetical protein
MLKLRIDILEQGSVISKEVAGYANQVIDMMYEEFQEPEMSKAEMFITHLAMAAQRVFTGAPLEELDETIWEEVMKSENFGKAETFYNKIQAISPVSCPEGERKFIMLHLCNLING